MSNNSEKVTQHYPMKFHGTGGEYFRIWFVNALLTAITLGIYSAWATVRRRRYFYGNTELNDDRFEYHATPIQILKGRLILLAGMIVFFLCLTFQPILGMVLWGLFFLLTPWITVRSWRYNAIMSSFRGIRFNYLCRIGRAYWVLLIFPLLMVLLIYGLPVGGMVLAAQSGESTLMIGVVLLSLFIALPALLIAPGIIHALYLDLYINNLYFGDSAFKATLRKGPFIKFNLIAGLIFLPFILTGSFFLALSMPHEAGIEESEIFLHSPLLFLSFYLFILVGILFSISYLHVAQRNYLFNQTTLNQGEIQLHSHMQFSSYLGLVITNSLMVLFTLGLATPVAEVRYARYTAEMTSVEGDLSLLNVHAHQDSANTAVAEEVAQAFDLGLGL